MYLRKGIIVKLTCLLTILCMCIMVANQWTKGDNVPQANHGIDDNYRDKETNTDRVINDSYTWNLILVNDHNYKPDDYTFELIELSNGEKIDSRIYPEMQEMFDAARADEIYPIVRDGYRTNQEQKDTFNNKLQTYIKEGYSKSEAEKLTKEWVATPGTSEHELGLAIDINADQKKSTNDEVYQWLAENAHLYGFILRYPKGKEEITGVNYEPWHYRYVGIEVAVEITENELTLEEYYEDIEIGD